MPRIRTIKPTFWDDDRVNNTPLPALLFFLGIKNFCDDKGIIIANDKLIKAKVFPQRDDIRLKDVSQWIANLKENSLLVPLSYNGKSYYALDFSEEKIDKPQPSILPDEALQDHSRFFLPHQNHSGTFENGPAGEGKEGKGNGEGKEGDSGAPAAPPRPPADEPGKDEKKEAKPKSLEDVKSYFVEQVGDPKKQNSWPEDRCFSVARRFFDFYEANGWVQGSSKKVIKDWRASARNWLRREIEGVFGARQPPAQKGTAPAPKPQPDKLAVELDYLYGMYLEEKCTVISIDAIHYDFLKRHNLVEFAEDVKVEIRKKAIAEKPDAEQDDQLLKKFMKKFGVLQFFEQMKSEGRRALI